MYGLGAVLFALLAGQPPVTGDRIANMLTALVVGTPIPLLRSLRDDLPHDLTAIVDRCLSKQPEQRFVSAKTVAKNLQDVS